MEDTPSDIDWNALIVAITDVIKLLLGLSPLSLFLVLLAIGIGLYFFMRFFKKKYSDKVNGIPIEAVNHFLEESSMSVQRITIEIELLKASFESVNENVRTIADTLKDIIPVDRSTLIEQVSLINASVSNISTKTDMLINKVGDVFVLANKIDARQSHEFPNDYRSDD